LCERFGIILKLQPTMKNRNFVSNNKFKVRIIFLAFLLALTFSLSTVNAQNDTMYIMKNGKVAGKYNVNTEVDSIIFYQLQTQTANAFTDSRDGIVYQTVTIGAQVWMAENLKYLPGVVSSATGSKTIPYYYVYGYDGTNVGDAKATADYTTYGVLYNWPAAMAGSSGSNSNPSGIQGVCPTGWHLPSDAEWTELTDYLGGEGVAGGKLKVTGTTHWVSPNIGATNETGFNALPGGFRSNYGTFGFMGMDGQWWSTTVFSSPNIWYRRMYYNGCNVYKRSTYIEMGLSVRCLRD
jgi:uncharacterized protein (TIGR02145 family)